MRRQIGFEIRDMWYNLGNLISSVFQYCFVLIVTKNKQTISYFSLDVFTSEDQSYKTLTVECWQLTCAASVVLSIYDYLPTKYPCTHYKST